MTALEARNILLTQMQAMTSAEYPVAWVGTLIEENEYTFCFEATVHATGEDPREGFHYWFVNKDISGGCERCVPDLR